MTTDWTDHNSHDPGITLLQLLAYTAEALIVVAAVTAWWSHRRRYETLDRADVECPDAPTWA